MDQTQSRAFRFYKDKNNCWFVDLPEWKGEQWELQMVMGADEMLDLMSQGENEVFVNISTIPNRHSRWILGLSENDVEDGATYQLVHEIYSFPVWLCHVTKFVFGEMPPMLYLNVSS